MDGATELGAARLFDAADVDPNMSKIAFSSHFASLLDFTVPNLLQRLGDASAFENLKLISFACHT